jgi:hypothetical protein
VRTVADTSCLNDESAIDVQCKLSVNRVDSCVQRLERGYATPCLICRK